MTPERIKELRAIESRMTKGAFLLGSNEANWLSEIIAEAPRFRIASCEGLLEDAEANARGLCFLRNAFPELLSEIERQAKRIEELEWALNETELRASNLRHERASFTGEETERERFEDYAEERAFRRMVTEIKSIRSAIASKGGAL